MAAEGADVFVMPVDGVFPSETLSTGPNPLLMITGQIASGRVAVDDEIVIQTAAGPERSSKVVGIQSLRSLVLQSAEKGDVVALAIRGLARGEVAAGDTVRGKPR